MAITIARSSARIAHSLDVGGAGYIAGQAPGLMTVSGAASSRAIEARHRASRRVVDVVLSDSDGTYLICGVDPAQRYDLIARDYTGAYNDVIISRVRPEPYDVQSVAGAFTANNGTHTLDGALAVVGGMGPHTVEVTSGSAPPGITFDVVIGTAPAFAATGRYVVATGTTIAGTYAWDLTITAANGSSQTIACTATFE